MSRSGQKSASALWGLAQQEAKEAKILTPDEAVAANPLQPRPADAGTGRAVRMARIQPVEAAQTRPEILSSIPRMNTRLRTIFGLRFRRTG